MFEDPFGRSPEWIKFAEPSSDNALRFTHRLSREWPIHLTPRFAEPINDRAMRFIHRWSTTRPSTSCHHS